MAGPLRMVAPFAGHVIGEGISESTLERVGTAVRAASEGEDALADGQTAEFKFRMVTSQQALEEELSIGVGIDARYGLFGGGARFDFARSSSLDTRSTLQALRTGGELYVLVPPGALGPLRRDPGNRAATLPLAEIKSKLDAEPFIGFLIAVLVGVEPTLIFEATPAD